MASFEQKPDMEEQALALAGEAGLGLGANLRVIDAFIEGLRNYVGGVAPTSLHCLERR